MNLIITIKHFISIYDKYINYKFMLDFFYIHDTILAIYKEQDKK